MGLFLDFFHDENKKNVKLYKNYINNTFAYLNSRQVADKNKSWQKKSLMNGKNLLNKIIKFKKKK